jgi:hypothetical protein
MSRANSQIILTISQVAQTSVLQWLEGDDPPLPEVSCAWGAGTDYD